MTTHLPGSHLNLGHQLNFFQNVTYFHAFEKLAYVDNSLSRGMYLPGQRFRLGLGASDGLHDLSDDLLERMELVVVENDLDWLLGCNFCILFVLFERSSWHRGKNKGMWSRFIVQSTKNRPFLQTFMALHQQFVAHKSGSLYIESTS